MGLWSISRGLRGLRDKGEYSVCSITLTTTSGRSGRPATCRNRRFGISANGSSVALDQIRFPQSFGLDGLEGDIMHRERHQR